MPTAARQLVTVLRRLDVNRVFWVPGKSYLPVLDALADEPAIGLVTCRHESGAGPMAVADAKMTDRPGVVFVSRGPGATNAALAVHTAEQDGAPLVLLSASCRVRTSNAASSRRSTTRGRSPTWPKARHG